MSDELLATINQNLIDMKADVAGLKTHLSSLVGNGAGRIDRLEDDVQELKAHQNYALGATGAFSFLVAGWEIVKHFWKVS